ncbi:DUF2958 domain-containing protein [Achromobacter xylosoxidans]|uniref:DUF2958 domain-containing protein n=1 Tax=Alcaligenes xylosoxydans xylosoxydans TaxID=85698 RepID=UPI0006C4F89E|nr:DUF2958 domain-containing protein [Achromobacter xylosoxidans]CUJ52988.1 Protein of uncharacterised function (DUF2958) [Achromobacter xylosoxidans]
MTLPAFLTDELHMRLLANGRIAQTATFDAYPVVKLFAPDGRAVWLLNALDPDNPDMAYGLCDLGTGDPKPGKVSLAELQALRGAQGLPVARDPDFRAEGPLSEYVRLVREEGRIVA